MCLIALDLNVTIVDAVASPPVAARCSLHSVIFPGLVSELPCATQKAAASERLLPERVPGEDASVAARGHPLFTVQQPGPATSTDSARIPGQ